MRLRRNVSLLLLITSVFFFATVVVARNKQKKSSASAQMDEHQRASHALNRLTFGPRPGDIERVEKIGVDKWIEQQLHPEKINDGALEARLAGLRTLRMSTREMLEDFPPQPLVKAVMDGNLPMPGDPAQRAVYEAQIDRLRNRQERKESAGGAQASPSSMQPASNTSPGPKTTETADESVTAQPAMRDDDRAQQREERSFAEQRAQSLMQLPPDRRYQEILRMDSGDRTILAQRLRPEERLRLVADLKPEQRETVIALANPQAVVQGELMEGKLLRAIYSERQLDEVMTDFWFNHFNVFIGKGADRYMITSYERDVIRPHALGKFKDLLEATAKSPAMLFYLDNWMSVGPNSQFAIYGNDRRAQNTPRPRAVYRRPWGPFGPPVVVMRGGRRPPAAPRSNGRPNAKKAPGGINENYARELMELHTLGVNGGYTQKDVTEVARVFTGWTLKEPRRGGEFEFDERRHEPGPKYVLGHNIKEHGEKEGEDVLNILAHSPSTARFISTKLAQRFVSDHPSQSLVDRMSQTFLEKDGDISEVLRTMFRSPEFWAPETYRAKVKTPLEFVVSAVRASGTEATTPMPLVQSLNRMGMPLYGAQPPTGYKDDAETWVNSAALLNRMNFGLALAAGRLPGMNFSAEALLGPSHNPPLATDPAQTVAQLENALLAGDVSKQTHETIRKQLTDPQVTNRALDDAPRPPNFALITGLILGSPEFQRR